MPKKNKPPPANRNGNLPGSATNGKRQQPLLTTEVLQNIILNSANFSSIATDSQGLIQFFNVGAERKLGYAAADVINKITPVEISDPEEIIARASTLSREAGTVIAPGFDALVFKASRGIEDIYELSYLRKDGSRLPTMVSVTALRDEQNAIIGYLLIGTDSTVRKQPDVDRVTLDQRLRDQQFYNRSLIESSIDALMTTDPQGIITDANQQMELLTAHTRADLIGAPFKDYFTDPERAESGIKKVLAEGKVANYELTALGRDGKETEVSYNATTFYDRDRHLLGVFAAARDITERKRAEEASQKTALYTRSLIEANLDPLVTISPGGKITDVNRATEKVTGRTRSELIDSDFSDYFTDPDQARAGYLKVLSEGQITDYPLTIRHVSGAITDVLYNASVYRNPSGDIEGVFAAARDITERKLAEKREREHTQIAHINRILQMLTANLPLTKVLDTIARDVESINPTMLCSILLLDSDGKHLRHGAAPSLPDFYNEAIEGLVIGPGAGSCGTAAFSGQRVIVQEIQTHSWWAPYLDLAQRAGVAACWSQPIFSAQGTVIGTFAVYNRHVYQPTDSELQLIEDEAHLTAIAIERTASETRLQLAASVFTHAREGIMITDAAATIIEVNTTFSLITGYSRGESVGRNPRMLKSGRQAPEFYASMWQELLNNGHWNGEIWNRRKNGEMFAAMYTISAVRGVGGKTQSYVALFTDITTAKEHQSQLEHMAHYDLLTGLPNRLLLADRLQHDIAQCQRHQHSLAIAYLDLDHFKEINDKYGHNVGDSLLIELSQRMKDALRQGDTLARIGGDEFVAILTDLQRTEDCYPVLDRLLRAPAGSVTVRAGVDVDGNIKEVVLQVSASIGVTIFPKDGANADQLLRHADQAMYTAKQAGKNRYHLFDVAQDVAIQTHHDSLGQIRTALDGKEFVLFYQPKVNMKTGAVVGAEALIRWQHPERGLLTPALFLSTIEDDQLSVELGEWVLASVLSQLCKWNTHGCNIPVSVKISARQLQDPKFAARLSGLLLEHPDVAPGSLELEVLETSALADIVHVSEVMRACQTLGVRFALDDFGTGYSSLTYLRRLPAEILKIDQSFVHDMINDPGDLAIVQGVIGLASAFHREVVAEGVETAAHGELLLSMGCELAQGYGIAKPMRAADLVGWITNWHLGAAWTA